MFIIWSTLCYSEWTSARWQSPDWDLGLLMGPILLWGEMVWDDRDDCFNTIDWKLFQYYAVKFTKQNDLLTLKFGL